MNPVNILTLKWGTLYSAEYVNRIYRGVKAHLHLALAAQSLPDAAVPGLAPQYIESRHRLRRHPAEALAAGFWNIRREIKGILP